MKWEVRGADRQTGQDRALLVDADTEAEAIAAGNTGGLLVERTRRVTGTASTVPGVQPARPSVQSDKALPYADGLKKGIPTYRGLVIAGAILRVYAFLVYALGVLLFLVALGNTNSNVASQDELLSNLIIPAGVLVTGGLLHGCATALDALRDIARNSFRLPT
jgi:hypothetical protein